MFGIVYLVFGRLYLVWCIWLAPECGKHHSTLSLLLVDQRSLFEWQLFKDFVESFPFLASLLLLFNPDDEDKAQVERLNLSPG